LEHNFNYFFKQFEKLNIKNIHYLKKYINICLKYKDVKLVNTHIHHILPSSLFPEFKNLSIHTFNSFILPVRVHLIAHYMLAKALGGNMWFAYNNMNAHNVKLSSRLYENGIAQMRLEMSKIAKNKVMAKDKTTGKIIKVSKYVFDNNDNLVGSMKNIFVGENNISKRPDIREKISKAKQGFINVFEIQSGKRTSIHRDNFNEQYYIKDKSAGKRLKNKIYVKDKNGNIFHVFKDDEKYLNGEYIHINKGRKHTPEQNLKCSQSSKGRKIQNVDNYKKPLYLIKDTMIFEILGFKELEQISDEFNISFSVLCEYSNKIVPYPKTNKCVNYAKRYNTSNWMLCK